MRSLPIYRGVLRELSPSSVRRGRLRLLRSRRSAERAGLAFAAVIVTAGVWSGTAQAWTQVHGGVYVIGDSISWGGETNPRHEAPYKFGALALLKEGESDTESVVSGSGADYQKAALPGARGSGAKTFIIQLGTNDVSCLNLPVDGPGTLKKEDDPLWSGACELAQGTSRPPTPDDTSQKAKDFRAAKMYTAGVNMVYLLNELLKIPEACVIWAGPREINVYGTKAQEWAVYNASVRSQLVVPAGRRFVSADYTAWANTQTTTYGDFLSLNRWNHLVPNVHQHLPGTSDRLADWLVRKVITDCGRAPRT